MNRRLGEFEQVLLFAVLRLGNEAYGARIRAEIHERIGRAPSPGAIYTALDRLQARGLVSSYVGEATPERGGRRKKYYRLEPAGAVSLHRTWKNVTGMAEGVIPQLTDLAHSGA
jgi:PadR family transcriptional regulator PadR